MTKALDKLKDDFQEKLKGDLVSVDFPEIGVDCFTRDVISGHRKGKILAALQKNQIMFCAEMVVNCCVDKNGAYIFHANDVREMMKEVDSTVIERVSTDISAIIFGDEDIETALSEDNHEEKAARKNSKATTS